MVAPFTARGASRTPWSAMSPYIAPVEHPVAPVRDVADQRGSLVAKLAMETALDHPLADVSGRRLLPAFGFRGQLFSRRERPSRRGRTARGPSRGCHGRGRGAPDDRAGRRCGACTDTYEVPPPPWGSTEIPGRATAVTSDPLGQRCRERWRSRSRRATLSDPGRGDQGVRRVRGEQYRRDRRGRHAGTKPDEPTRRPTMDGGHPALV
jgi:hypothetical protein